MKPPPNTTKVLKAEAEKLTKRIFSHKYCVVQYKKTGKQKFWKVEKHHLIHKSRSDRFKFNIWNILPISDTDHRTGKEAAHEDREKFLAWVRKNLPLHWAWYMEHKDEPPHTLYTTDWAKICDDLRHYEKHPLEAEQLIYEK